MAPRPPALHRGVVQRRAAGVVQAALYANDRHECIANVIAKIIARLDASHDAIAQRVYGGGGRVPTLATLASKTVTSQLPGSLEGSKRSWQFAATGVLDSSPEHDTQAVYATNNLASLKAPVEGLSSLSTIPDRVEKVIKPGGRVYHAETRLASEGCKHISVTDGRNCLFCSLFFLAKGIPYEYHTGDVKSWHLPEPLSIRDYFGADIEQYIQQPKFTTAWGPIASTQALIDLLTTTNQYWW
jgi:hypothetical protein